LSKTLEIAPRRRYRRGGLVFSWRSVCPGRFCGARDVCRFALLWRLNGARVSGCSDAAGRRPAGHGSQAAGCGQRHPPGSTRGRRTAAAAVRAGFRTHSPPSI